MVVLHLLQLLLEGVGAAISLVAVGALWGAVALFVSEDLNEVSRHIERSRRDARMFKQIEEFQRDFS